MGLFGSKRSESILGVDIGGSSIKVVELELTVDRPVLRGLAIAALPADVFTGNQIVKTDQVATALRELLASQSIGASEAAFSLAAPGVFTKRIQMSKAPQKELASNVQLEAGNFIPHKLDAVKIDYHVIGSKGRDQLEVLVVAAKNEVVDSFVESVEQAGLTPAIGDVDVFALQNVFELSYPEHLSSTVALLDVGARFTGVNICRGGQMLFMGDVSVGGRQCSEAVAQALGVGSAEAERVKRAMDVPADKRQEFDEAVARHVEQATTELNRQISFLWSASGIDGGIDRVMVTGGGAALPGFLEALQQKTGLPCERLEPFRGIATDEGFDSALIAEMGPVTAIAAGLALRQVGDRPELELE